MEAIEQLGSVARNAGEFLLISVCLRYIVAHKIGEYLERKMAEHPIKYERWHAIWNHYQMRAQGSGHDSRSVVNCTQGQCMSFTG